MVRTVPFQDVLHRVWFRAGGDPAVVNNLDTVTARALGEYIRAAYRVAYEWYEWPEAITVEERTFVNQHSPWADDDGAMMGHIFMVRTADPRVNRGARRVSFWTAADGLYVEAGQASRLWVVYRRVPPDFTAVDYSASATYRQNDTVYYSGTGECYRAKETISGVAPAKGDRSVNEGWEKLDFLRLLEPAVVQMALSEWLREEGQYASSAMPDALAEDLLIQEKEKMELQEGQWRLIRH